MAEGHSLEDIERGVKVHEPAPEDQTARESWNRDGDINPEFKEHWDRKQEEARQQRIQEDKDALKKADPAKKPSKSSGSVSSNSKSKDVSIMEKYPWLRSLPAKERDEWIKSIENDGKSSSSKSSTGTKRKKPGKRN